MAIFQQKFHCQVIFPNMWFENRHLMLPEGKFWRNNCIQNFFRFLGCNYAYTILSDSDYMNAINVHLQCFQGTLDNHVLIRFFCYLIEEKCFHQLRTTEQLSYIVNCDPYSLYSIRGFQIILQTQHDLNHVHQRIEQFLHSILVCRSFKWNNL